MRALAVSDGTTGTGWSPAAQCSSPIRAGGWPGGSAAHRAAGWAGVACCFFSSLSGKLTGWQMSLAKLFFYHAGLAH